MIKRLEDEIWTSYIARTLELQGIKISEFKPVGYDNAYAQTENGVLTLERRISPEKFSSKYTFLYDTFSRACLQERAFVNFLPIEDVYEFQMEFLFLPTGRTEFKNNIDFVILGNLSRYQDGRTYDSYDVVRDLIEHAKNPEESQLLFYL